MTLSKRVESWNRGKAGNGVELNEKIDICAYLVINGRKG